MTSLRAAEYPHPSHVLVHLSDTHFLPEGELLHGVAPMREHLEGLLADLEATNLRPEALIFTGDLADRGEEEAYRILRGIVEPLTQRLGAELIWVMGNHDDRATMRRTLLDEAADTADLTEPYDRVIMLGGLRIVVLDSTVPGRHHGEIAPSQLEWLAAVLTEPAPEGTILALHHPPAPCAIDILVTFELRDQAALAAVLAGTDVRAILAGHYHLSSSATFAGIPVSIASATCYTQDLQTPDRGMRGRDAAQAFNLVHVYADTILHSVVPMGGGATVGSPVDAAATAERLAAAGMYIPGAPVLEPVVGDAVH